MKCSKCGKEIEDGWRFCNFCGNKIEIKNEIINAKDEEKLSDNKEIKSAQDMYKYCLDNGFGSGFNETWGIKHFSIIENALLEDEYIIMTFIGLMNYITVNKHNGNVAYAITNKRIILAQKLFFGENLKTVSLDNINDITYSEGIAYGTVTFDTLKEVFSVTTNKYDAKRISERIHKELDSLNRISKNTQNNNFNNLEKIKKLKELLDIDAITKEEFEEKKKELLK